MLTGYNTMYKRKAINHLDAGTKKYMQVLVNY